MTMCNKVVSYSVKPKENYHYCAVSINFMERFNILQLVHCFGFTALISNFVTCPTLNGRLVNIVKSLSKLQNHARWQKMKANVAFVY